MNLGERIYRLRKQRNMSQGELADLLEVSRQSISKWETDASVPELDKLVRLAEVFGVTLDGLVLGAAPDVSAHDGHFSGDGSAQAAPDDGAELASSDGASGTAQGTPPDETAHPASPEDTAACSGENAADGCSSFRVGTDRESRQHHAPEGDPWAQYRAYDGPPVKPAVSPTQRTVGFILLTVGLLAAVLLMAFAGWGAAILAAPPLVLCAVICLNCRRRAGLWCCWTLYVYASLVLRLATGVSTGLIVSYLRGYMAWSMSLVVAMVYVGCGVALLAGTLLAFRGLRCPWNRRTLGLLAGSGLAAAAAHVVPMWMVWMMQRMLQGSSYQALAVPMFWYQLGMWALEMVELAGAAVFLTVLAGRIRDWRARRRDV